MSTSLPASPLRPPAAERAGGASFASLRHPAYRAYCATSMGSMLGDNIEHVITYWVLWQAFHSPLLAGFAVIAHWSPALFFSVWSGQLADRHDCRRIIQVGQGLFILVNLSWAVLFVTGTLQWWHAVILLIGHGMAGAFWGPPSQLIIHDIVGPQELPSAVRLNATARQLAVLFGPAVGGFLMLLLSPAGGLVVNALLFLPLSLWLMRVPYTGHLRDDARGPSRQSLRWTEAFTVLREARGNRAIMAMVALAGVSALLIGNAFQAQMPGFAHDLGTDNAGFGYSMLLGANAAGAFFGGILLEGTGLLRPSVRAAIVTAGLWCLAIGGFAAAQSYPLAVALLFVAGMLNLGYTAMAQALVQLLAPPDQRGRMVGLFNMAGFGLRVGSGVTVGVLGNVIGIHWALGLSAAVLLLAVLVLYGYARGSEAAVAFAGKPAARA
ncbi:MAG TPA: MFS transporter [Chloroflexota bacterium]|nr:MFS transporter [Chloroflexota bacterium]